MQQRIRSARQATRKALEFIPNKERQGMGRGEKEAGNSKYGLEMYLRGWAFA